MNKLAYEDALKEWKRFEQYLVETRYGMRDPETGELLEHTYDDVIERVIRTLKERTSLSDEVYDYLRKRIIIPASPVLMNLGSPRKNKTYFSCFPLGQVEDTMEDIMETAVRMSHIYKCGGGVGIDLSKLRPRNSFVDKKQGYSSGPVGFLPLYDAITGVIGQGGCFHYDTLIYTDQGLLPIGEIVENKLKIKVWTPFGWKRIINWFKNGKKRFYKVIDEEHSYSVLVTPDHHFYTWRDNTFTSKPIVEFYPSKEDLKLLVDVNWKVWMGESVGGCKEPHLINLKCGGIIGTDIKGEGYDLEIEDVAMYIANGYLVHNSRRGALLVSLDAKHQDAIAFAKCKWDKEVQKEIGNYQLNNMNISLMVWDKADLLENKELLDAVVEGMYYRGDPGLLFVMNQNESTTSISMEYEPYWSNPCLSEGTWVLVTDKDGRIGRYIAIEAVKVGDYVLSYNFQAKKIEPKRVLRAMKTKTNAHVVNTIFTDDQQEIAIYRTPDHKIFDPSIGEFTDTPASCLAFDNKVLYFAKEVDNGYHVDVYDLTVEDNHNFFANGVLVSNCGEYLSVANTSCSLITVNLPECYREAKRQNASFEKIVRKASSYATEIMSWINTFSEGYPDDKIFNMNSEIFPVGVGATGFHGLLILLGIPYYSIDEVIDIAKQVYKNILAGAIEKSHAIVHNDIKKYNDIIGFIGMDSMKWNQAFVNRLLKEYTDDYTIYLLLKTNEFANLTVTTQMPAGSVSQFAYSASTGIEPLFSVVTKRRVRDFNNNWVDFTIVPLEAIEVNKSFEELEKETSLCLSGYEQIDLLAEVLKWQTTNISKTINIPADFPKDEIKSLIEYAIEKGLKGLTVFRDSSAEQVLQKGDTKSIVFHSQGEKTESNFHSEKEMPDIREGRTYKFRGPISLYITINKHDKKIKEVFLTMGKAGSTVSTLNKALGRVISVALQKDPDLINKIIDTLEGMGGDLTLINSELGMTTSVPDAVARALKKELDIEVNDIIFVESSNLSMCPNCGKMTLRRNGGCNQCLSCGYSSC